MARLRLDKALVARQLVATRSKARDVILRGLVKVAGQVVEKPAALVGADAVIELPCEAGRHVSRGAAKLTAAMDAFDFDAFNRICLDVGAATGGFSQVLLERGAAKVYAVDVGHAQLHDSLRLDPRVVALERCDARSLSRDLIPDRIGAIVCDVSFISLTKMLVAPLGLAGSGAWLAALIKPQFEAGREAIGKGGIVRNAADRAASIAKVGDWLGDVAGWRVIDVVPSPIAGGSGNQEFLIGAVYRGVTGDDVTGDDVTGDDVTGDGCAHGG